MSTPFDDLYALSDAARLWEKDDSTLRRAILNGKLLEGKEVWQAVGCYESCNDSRIWRTESWGIALGFLFLPTCPPRQRFLYRRTEKKKPTHCAGLDIPASRDYASLLQEK